MHLKPWIVVFAAIAALAAEASAQSTYGEIRGTVTDATGAVIVGAAVTAKNVGTGESRRVVSDPAVFTTACAPSARPRKRWRRW